MFTHTRDRTGLQANVLVIATTGALGFLLYRSLSTYGVSGTINYIWVGDPYPDLREYLNSLKQVEKTLDLEDEKISSIEESLERARLDSIDAADDSSILAIWEKNTSVQRDLRTEIALLSDRLDKLAAKVDNIPGIDKVDIRSRKKSLSRKNVLLMERADALICFYKKAKLG